MAVNQGKTKETGTYKLEKKLTKNYPKMMNESYGFIVYKRG